MICCCGTCSRLGDFHGSTGIRWWGGERIKKHLFRVMEWLTIARPQGENLRQLEKVNLRLEVLRIQTWFAKDLQCLKCKSCGFAVQWTHEDTRPQARATA